MSLGEVKKELRKLEKEKIIDLIADLYNKNKSVKEYLDFYASPDEKIIFEKYKAKVYESFYPKRGFGYKLKDGKKVITDFKKLGTSSEYLADLMLFYVETGVKFTNDFGDINESFYNSLASTYLQAVQLMQDEDILEKFSLRAEQVVDDSENLGFGFYDYLFEVFAEYFPDSFEEVKE